MTISLSTLTYSLITVFLTLIISYLAHLDRIFAVDYVPSTQDILCYSTLTSGITKTVFEGDQSESSYHVIDLGGSRAEQRKWIRAFHHVSVLIFIVPVDGYARCLPEDETRVSAS